MKIRIRGNSLRLRLTQSEVKQFKDTGEIMNLSHFGTGHLVYGLKLYEGDQLESLYQQNQIIVNVPKEQGLHWASSEEVGMDNHQASDENSGMKILVEKDFQCLKTRPGGEDDDTFPNPDA